MTSRHNNDVWKLEEQYLLRIRDANLAERLRDALNGSESEQMPDLEIIFSDSDVSGVLRFEGRDYQLTLLNLPTVTESYKTYDDINLVKTGDIGQVLVVGDISEEEANTGEISDGVTLPLRKARSRIFRKATPVSPEAVARVESQILDVLSGGAPQGYKFVDTEEVWQVDPETGIGRWAAAHK